MKGKNTLAKILVVYCVIAGIAASIMGILLGNAEIPYTHIAGSKFITAIVVYEFWIKERS
jgi:hypothetical protein